MARDFDGTNDQIEFGNLTDIAGITTVSVSGWVWNDILTTDMNIVECSASTTYGFRLYFDDVGSVSGRTDMYNWVVTETAAAGGSSVRIETATGSATSGAWQHISTGFVAGSATGLQIWIDGAEDANSPANVSALANSGPTTGALSFGETNGNVADRDGKLAEYGIWNRDLTDSERVSLSKGLSPLFFPNGLIFYAPMIGNYNPEVDLRGGASGTVSGATAFSHPRIIYPSASQMRRFKAAGGVITSVKDLIGGFIPFAR